MTCLTCIFWDYQHSWLEDVPLDIQYVADCERVRLAHCRCHSPNAFVVPEMRSPNGFKILSLFPATTSDTMCGDYEEDVNRMGSSTNDNEKSETSG